MTKKTYIKKQYFINVAESCGRDTTEMLKQFQKDGHTIKMQALKHRLKKFIVKGYLTLDSGNKVSLGEALKGTSTLYADDGSIKMQWVKSDVDAETRIAAIEATIEELASTITPIQEIPKPTLISNEDLATVYISNDVHLGLLTEKVETGTNWNLEEGVAALKSSYDHLFTTSPDSRVGIVLDLGDLTEADGFRNSTAKSSNPLDISNRFPVVLRAAYESLIYAVNLALLKHEIVYFYNVEGNHDNANSVAIREILRQTFRDNPRVIVDDLSSSIKYHQHGQTLLGFAHGDGLKMAKAGEAMAIDCQDIFSETQHRFFHFGHYHVDAVRDSAICRSESHRNLPPQNHWANSMGYRRGIGTMKSVTYSSSLGEVSRSLFNIIH